MNNLIAICGLDCEKCYAYIATKTNDNELREKTAKLWSELNSVEILPEMINCEGCRTEGVKTVYCSTMCPIRQCAIQKKYKTCGECKEINNCINIKPVIESSPDVLDNIKKSL